MRKPGWATSAPDVTLWTKSCTNCSKRRGRFPLICYFGTLGLCFEVLAYANPYANQPDFVGVRDRSPLCANPVHMRETGHPRTRADPLPLASGQVTTGSRPAQMVRRGARYDNGYDNQVRHQSPSAWDSPSTAALAAVSEVCP
jgi:hypothetical protein